jgi:hypothetical protein
MSSVNTVGLIMLLFSMASAQITSNTHPCKDPLSSKALSEAVDASLMSLHGQSGWLHSLRHSTGYTHPIEVTTCTPKVSMWSWPSATSTDGQLADVLLTGKLRVAGVKWSKGGAADYITDELAPTGFWPEYMHAIANTISSHYGKPITVQRVYYANSDLVTKAVASGTVHMSEPYYYLSGFHDNKPRIEALHTSCVTVATASAFSSTKASGIKSMDGLYDKIVQGPNRRLGFIGAGNYDAVSHVLPSNVEPVYITDSDMLEKAVDNGTLLASYISEGSASEAGTRFVYETGVVSPRVALFRQDDTKHCVHRSALAEVAATGNQKEDSLGIEEDNCTLLVIVVIILAVATLMLTCLLGLLICKERSGRPLFMTPLKDAVDPAGQVVGSACRI